MTFSEHLSASIYICVIYNIHHKKWSVYINKTHEEDKYCYALTHFVDKPTCILDIAGYHGNFPKLSFTSCLD